MAKEDYYSLLGVDRHAPERAIKQAYYKLARELHPDHAKSPEEATENANRLATISKAYNILKDPQKRAEYDTTMAGKPAGVSGSAAGKSTPAAKPAGPTAAGSTPAKPAAGAGASAQPGARAVSASDMASQRTVTAMKAFVRGMDFFKNADYKSALPFFETAVKNDPESEAQYHLRLAICLMKTKGSFTRAAEAAMKACEMDAYNMEYRLQLGEIYELAGVQSKAIEVYQEALKWEPTNQRVLDRLRLLGVDNGPKPSAMKGILAKVFPSIFGK